MLSECLTRVDRFNRELLRHGTAAFPIACYHDDLSREDVPWHWHDELEAAIVTEGTVRVVIGAEQFDIPAGGGFFVNSDVLHSCHHACSGACRLHSLVFHPRLVGGSAESVFHQRYVLPVTGNKGLAGLCLDQETDWQAAIMTQLEAAWQACAAEPAGYELDIRYALSRVLALLGEHAPVHAAAANPKAMRDGERIKVMLQFIMEHYGEGIDTAAIARSASLSESECLRCFKASIGTTPIRYLREYRIDRAASLLAGGEAISDTVARCGFRDISYFTKTFRELKGMTPGEYRRNARTGTQEEGSSHE